MQGDYQYNSVPTGAFGYHQYSPVSAGVFGHNQQKQPVSQIYHQTVTGAFGASSSPFDGSAVLGQKPDFGSGLKAQSAQFPFGGLPLQSQPASGFQAGYQSAFGSPPQQLQSAYGGSFGSSTSSGALRQSSWGYDSPPLPSPRVPPDPPVSDAEKGRHSWYVGPAKGIYYTDPSSADS